MKCSCSPFIRLIIKQRWEQLRNVLTSAAESGNASYEEALHNSENCFDGSLLHFVCQFKPPLYIVEELVSANNNPVTVFEVDSKNRLPLHIAVEERAPSDVIEYLLARNEEAATTQDNDGRTPLHLLFHYNHRSIDDFDLEDDETFEIALSLCKAAPMSLMIEDRNGMSVLEYAIENEAEIDIIRMLQNMTRNVIKCKSEERIDGKVGYHLRSCSSSVSSFTTDVSAPVTILSKAA